MQKKKHGFTLAETLITLVIIGIVAALTIPTIMTNKEKETIPLQLKKFYLNLEQGTRLYTHSVNDISFNPNTINNSEKTLELWKKYFSKYFSTISEEALDDKWIKVVFNDGTSFIGRIQDSDRFYFFFCTKNNCPIEEFNGKRSFLFTMYYGKIYTSFDGETPTRATMLESCKNPSLQKHWCTRLIQVDGWKMADDYPW